MVKRNDFWLKCTAPDAAPEAEDFITSTSKRTSETTKSDFAKGIHTGVVGLIKKRPNHIFWGLILEW